MRTDLSVTDRHIVLGPTVYLKEGTVAVKTLIFLFASKLRATDWGAGVLLKCRDVGIEQTLLLGASTGRCRFEKSELVLLLSSGSRAAGRCQRASWCVHRTHVVYTSLHIAPRSQAPSRLFL